MYKSPSSNRKRPGSNQKHEQMTLKSPERVLHSALADLVIQTSEVERKIELTRQILCESRKFDAVTAFWRLDRREVNEINFDDFVAFLEDHNLFDPENYEETQDYLK